VFTSHDIGAMAVILAGVVLITLAKARATATPVAQTPAQAQPANTNANTPPRERAPENEPVA